jgi:hypothetical protein
LGPVIGTSRDGEQDETDGSDVRGGEFAERFHGASWWSFARHADLQRGSPCSTGIFPGVLMPLHDLTPDFRSANGVMPKGYLGISARVVTKTRNDKMKIAQ